MGNATRMMAVNRVKGESGEQGRYEESRRRSRMEAEGGRYEGGRYEGGRYESGRYEGAEAYHDDGYDVKIRRERRSHEDSWPEDRGEPMDGYGRRRRMESRETMPRIGFEGGSEREMISFPHKGKSMKGGMRLEKHDAAEWIENMKNEDGSRGGKWTMEQTEKIRKQNGLEVDPVEFWAAMNASYSDLCKLAEKHGVNTPEFWVDYVMDFWFHDKDAGEHKVARYYETFGQ